MDKLWIIAGAVFVLSFIIMSFRDRRYLLYGYVISLPWFGLYMVLSLTVSPDRILALCMLFYVVFNLRKLTFGKIYKSIIIFLGWAIFITVFLAVFAPVNTYDYSPLRGDYKWVPGMFLYILYIVPVVFAATIIKERKEIRTLGKMLVCSIAVLAVLGLVQFIIWRFSGIDITPVYLLQQNIIETRTILLNSSGGNILRIASMGGEPKHLAYSLVVGLSIVAVEIINKGFKPILALLLFLFAAVLLLTFSTQGYILVILNLVALFIATIFVKEKIWFKRSIVFIFLAVAAVGIFFHYFPGYFDLSKQRSTGRVLGQADRYLTQQDGLFLLQDSDKTIYDFFKDQPAFIPSGVGIGNIHIRARDYIPEYALSYIMIMPFSAKSGALRFVSDIGAIGLILFLLAYLTPLVKLNRLGGKTQIEQQFFIIALIVLMDFLLSFDGPNYFSITMAIGYVFLTLRLKEGEIKKA